MQDTTVKRVAITGTISSGKSQVAKILTELGFKHVSLSDMIRKVVKDKHLPETRATLIDTGNWMRKRDGIGILARMVSDQMGGDTETNLVVETIRNPAEADILKDRLGCELWCVDAPLELRFQRLVARNRDGDAVTKEEFMKINERDLGKDEPVNGQQVGKCIQMADVVIINDGSEEELRAKVMEALQRRQDKHK